MANLKTSCIRKGVVLGRIITGLNELHTQLEVLDDADLPISTGAIAEVTKSLGPLKRNFKTSAAEVQAISENAKKISKALKDQSNPEVKTEIKTALRNIRDNFRKVVKEGYAGCGARASDLYYVDQVISDNARYSDVHGMPSWPS